MSKTITEEYTFLSQGYKLSSTRKVADRVVRIFIKIDRSYSFQSTIEAHLFDGNKFNRIHSLSGENHEGPYPVGDNWKDFLNELAAKLEEDTYKILTA